jgi:hypothetical protein
LGWGIRISVVLSSGWLSVKPELDWEQALIRNRKRSERRERSSFTI